jgi:hypothetical protein
VGLFTRGSEEIVTYSVHLQQRRGPGVKDEAITLNSVHAGFIAIYSEPSEPILSHTLKRSSQFEAIAHRVVNNVC